MKKIVIALLSVTLVIVAAGAVFGVYALNRINAPYKGFSEPEKFVQIPQGSGAAEIRRRLVGSGIVSDQWAFRAALAWTGRSRALKAGEYRFDRPMSVVDVIDKLARGDVYAHPITFPEGLTIREMAAIYQSQGFGVADDFIRAARDGSLVKDLDPAATDLEGYLFPEILHPAPRDACVKADFDDGRQVSRDLHTDRSKTRWRTGSVPAAGRDAGLARGEGNRQGRGAVHRGRGLPEPSDAQHPDAGRSDRRGRAVAAGTYDGNIRKRDLEFDSPYNTYKYAGLPPGPIAAPASAALEAALAPANVSYLYFVSRNDGSHVFAETLAEHNANVDEHQVLYFRNQRAERQRQPRNGTR